MLDSKDIEILLTIQSNPLATASSIAEQIDMSISGTIDRINRLLHEMSVFQNVIADLNLEALELEIHDFFFKVKSRKSLKLLEEVFCYYHPYVIYRGRCNGYFSGLYIQFRTPKGALKYLKEIAELLGKKGIIQHYEYIERDRDEKTVYVESAISSWDSNTHNWNFNWENWRKGFLKNNTESINNKPNSRKILSELTVQDIQLLSQLTIDGKRKNTTMMKNLDIKNEAGVKQKIGRRVAFLKENAIINYRLSLNHSAFDLYQTIIFRGNCGVDIARKLRNYLYKNQEQYANSIKNNIPIDQENPVFPFSGLFFIAENGFLWYVRAPPKHLSELNDFMLEICLQHNLFIIDHKFSKNYALWDQTFDTKDKKWKASKDFMVDSVMENICKASK